jgi:hypothetical protein
MILPELNQPYCRLTMLSGIDSYYVSLYNQESGTLNYMLRTQSYFFGAFFLPATVLRLPFLVRLFVLVR